jgi:hypothetical protein
MENIAVALEEKFEPFVAEVFGRCLRIVQATTDTVYDEAKKSDYFEVELYARSLDLISALATS